MTHPHPLPDFQIKSNNPNELNEKEIYMHMLQRIFKHHIDSIPLLLFNLYLISASDIRVYPLIQLIQRQLIKLITIWIF